MKLSQLERDILLYIDDRYPIARTESDRKKMIAIGERPLPTADDVAGQFSFHIRDDLKAAVDKLIAFQCVESVYLYARDDFTEIGLHAGHTVRMPIAKQGNGIQALQVTDIGKSVIQAKNEGEAKPMAAAPDPVEAIEVFFSYSHTDEKMRVKLEKHLSTLRREKVIAGWHDRKIMPGTEWKDQIDAHLESSQLILLLISADFLSSEYCYDVEMTRAIARHDAGEARVIPIILRPCDWLKSPFSKLQALPRDGKPVSDWVTQDHAFSEVARGIRRVVEEMSKALQSGHRVSAKPAEATKDMKAAAPPQPAPVHDGVYISNSIIEKLERMRFINAVIKSEDEAFEDEGLLTEYHGHLEEMVETFLPVIKQLVKAGLLTSSINIEDIENIGQYSTLTGEPTLAFDNGNIWIDTEYAGGALRKETAATPPSPKQELFVKKWGCYMFEGDKEMYCPGCYANGKKSPTTRLSSRFRQCTVCNATLGSG